VEREELLELFRSSGALLEGHFQLSSGRHADRYFQCARVLMDPRRAEKLAQAFAHAVSSEVEIVVGPALGAVIWSHEVARALGVPGMFTERVDGEMTLRRGFRLEPGKRVLVVEDVLTTGGSAREVIALLRDLGAEVAEVGAIVNRSGRANPFEDLELDLTCLAEIPVTSWEAGECPLCAQGVAIDKPGSRPGPASVSR
jgi:orotate phosphoribosyltransferase